MFHRFSTWWRALSVVLLGLATLTWPSPAQAEATADFSVISQDAVASLSNAGASSFNLDLSIPNGATNNVVLSAFPELVYRSQVSAIIAGDGTTGAPVASTGVITPTCATGSTLDLKISLFSALGTGASHRCGSQPVHLRLPCHAAACDGVYPLSIVVNINNVRHIEWSLIAVRASSVLNPLLVDFVPVVDPTAWSSPELAESNFAVIAKYSTMPLTLAVDYRPLSRALLSSSGSKSKWSTALSSALKSPEHRAIAAPPSSVDFAGLAANGFASEVPRQITLASQFLQTLTGRSTDGPAYFAIPPSGADLTALSQAGISRVVVPDGSFSVTPSTTLNWGAPFHLTGVANVVALATDGELTQLAQDAAIEPGRRAAMTLATLAFLHFELPNASAVRTVVLPLNVGSDSPTYLNDLLGASQSNPFITPSTLTPSFNSSLVGTNESPFERDLSPQPVSVWSSSNVSDLKLLIQHTDSYLQAIASTTQMVALETYLAVAEQKGSPTDRASGLALSSSYLAKQLAGFRIDNSTITLTGSVTELPITLFSGARYPVTVILHLITNRLTFPKGNVQPETLSTPTTPLRISAIDKSGDGLTLQLELTTPDDSLILAQAPVQVRVTGTSVVGYVLSAASLLVLAWWWLRTYRRKSRGRHAR